MRLEVLDFRQFLHRTFRSPDGVRTAGPESDPTLRLYATLGDFFHVYAMRVRPQGPGRQEVDADLAIVAPSKEEVVVHDSYAREFEALTEIADGAMATVTLGRSEYVVYVVPFTVEQEIPDDFDIDEIGG